MKIVQQTKLSDLIDKGAKYIALGLSDNALVRELLGQVGYSVSKDSVSKKVLAINSDGENRYHIQRTLAGEVTLTKEDQLVLSVNS